MIQTSGNLSHRTTTEVMQQTTPVYLTLAWQHTRNLVWAAPSISMVLELARPATGKAARPPDGALVSLSNISHDLQAALHQRTSALHKSFCRET